MAELLSRVYMVKALPDQCQVDGTTAHMTFDVTPEGGPTFRLVLSGPTSASAEHFVGSVQATAAWLAETLGGRLGHAQAYKDLAAEHMPVKGKLN